MSSLFRPVTATVQAEPGTPIHQANPNSAIEFVVHFTAAMDLDKALIHQKTIFDPPAKRNYLNREELAAFSGATGEDIQKVTAYLAQFSIVQTKQNSLARTAHYKGLVADINKALNTTLHVYQGVRNETFHGYSGALHLPLELHKLVQHISGITPERRIERRTPHFVKAQDSSLQTQPTGGYTTQQLARAYSFPEGSTGAGQCIGIIELGGEFKTADIQQYFKKTGLPLPEIKIVGDPLPNNDSVLNNSEVTLDIQVAATVAPGAKIVVYYGPTILDAMKLVLQDKENDPSVVSISWAGSEFSYTPFQISELNQVFYEASLLGITVIAASGDHGAFNSLKFLNVTVPAANPFVIGCGGTEPTLDKNDRITSDAVWNQQNGQIGSGGGFSRLYPLPGYQYAAVAQYPFVKGATRAVPDVAANASGINGYKVVFNGVEMPIGGTSASTPLWAGLITLLNAILGYRLGFVTPFLYQLGGSEAFTPITTGNNGYYPASAFWNPATGLGSPNGEQLLELLKTLHTSDGA